MAKTYYILSTLTADQRYTRYAPGGGDLPIVEAEVFVKGGANVADKRLITPQGVVTGPLTDDQMAILESNSVFQLHKQNGFVTVSEAKPLDADAAAASQANRDDSAPLVEGDFAEGKAPVVAGVQDQEAEAPLQPAVRGNSRRA